MTLSSFTSLDHGLQVKNWPYGRSELTSLIRDYDWAATTLGPIKKWPQSLKTSVDIILNCPVPIVMLWGVKGIMIYNDAFSLFAGNRHPESLGCSVLECWPEVADFNRNVIKTCLAGGTLEYQDQHLVLYPNGKAEDIWAELTYSPIMDEGGTPRGVLAIVVDTTERVLTQRAIQENDTKLHFLSDLEEAVRGLRDAEEIMAVTTRMTAEHFRSTRCAYADVEEDGDTFNLRYDHITQPDLSSSIGNYSLKLFGSKAVKSMTEGATLVINDATQDISKDDGLAMFLSIDAQALIVCPLVKDGCLQALMCLKQDIPRAWTQSEIELMDTVAERSWAHIERVRDEARLTDSEKDFRDLTDSIHQLVWVTRADGYHEYYNQRWYDYTGLPIGSMHGYDWNAVMHPDDWARAEARWQLSLNTGVPHEIEYRLRRADGVYRWVLGRSECVRDETGKITKWYGTCTDIQDLVDARHAAESANIAKTEFLANMSHEIRTPMNAIIGLSNILAATSPLNQKQKDFLRTLQNSADGLLALINDLLDIAKIEAQSITLEEIPFNLSHMMQEVVSMMNVRAREKNLVFTVSDQISKDRLFLSDPTRIKQIILNLCSNAVKFTDSGGVDITIRCRPHEQPGIELVQITVKDTGIGIAQKQLQTIFEKFVQADTSINRKYGGTGLGLAITKTLTEILGGTIAVESEQGKGSAFTVKLPLLYIKQEKIEEDIAMASEEIKPSPLHQEKVLLVEDYEANILVATTYLEQFGYEYDLANDGLEAVEKFKVNRYGAILMDVQMHGMNGFDATALIRELEQQAGSKPTPIIGMTAHALAGDKERCLAAGMDDYLSKPFNPDELESKLSHYMAAAF